ncbi:ubiquitin-like protein Pup [Bifidobacterium subtile]|jgi:ubiquitin-like protein Pup|uniref:Prokaryotic ubiquitin-like protein Pup n=1 Tax=Bifidobacterium subtile TaxID=77635 RepID=A0A087EB35_9BIFI|nr:ubiquitin-like protein Pup [Bifidobacterium subtile]KFJ04986.1 Prokaryotic ubiquitin-like protein Pup [Bifidobacterium subtile]MCI1223921.1 ubiquitin-like protein Pup [Bifidobacterium subtile]MCI1241352.1 ubiquitin-like protein Pup [Bifidobacterium subtile]MCI1258091.1 ubiquitin-like protein Pup [Bifidobacterium subtile]QOL37112.1 ubiquitin-like protein Pup [Bifidobacterium subtile]
MPQQFQRRQSQDDQFDNVEALRTREAEDAAAARQTNSKADQGDALDSILDDIESTLESNAEEYVGNFVQKGGQ